MKTRKKLVGHCKDISFPNIFDELNALELVSQINNMAFMFSQTFVTQTYTQSLVKSTDGK